MSCWRTGVSVMATLLDTSALVVLTRRHPRPGTEGVVRAAERELKGGQCFISAVTVTEMLVGVRTGVQALRLERLLEPIGRVSVLLEIAAAAGQMGAWVRHLARPVPATDLLIAATAVWLDVPLLTCDADFARPPAQALKNLIPGNGAAAEGARLWQELQLHPASVV